MSLIAILWLMVGLTIYGDRPDLGCEIILTWPYHFVRSFLK